MTLPGRPASWTNDAEDLPYAVLVHTGNKVRYNDVAVELIGALVEQYGQFGSAVPTKPHDLGGYDNSFLVADPHESWVVEAVGRRWLAQRFDHGTTSISE